MADMLLELLGIIPACAGSTLRSMSSRSRVFRAK